MELLTFIGWVTQSILAPEAFSRVIDGFRASPDEYKALTKQVKELSGVKPNKAYERWVADADNWHGITVRPDEAYQSLVEDLQEKLLEYAAEIGNSRDLSLAQERAAKLVNATLAVLIESLSPSRAIRVTELRIRHQLFHESRRNRAAVDELRDDVMMALGGSALADGSLGAGLVSFPPPVADALIKLERLDAANAKRLRLLLPDDPSMAQVASELALQPPAWLLASHPLAFVVLAEILDSYDLKSMASVTFERAAREGLERSRNLARAGYAAVCAGDEHRAAGLMENEPSSPLRTALLALSREDTNQLASIPLADVESEPWAAVNVINSRRMYGIDEVISGYRSLLVLHPRVASIKILLGEELLRQSLRPLEPNRNSYRREAMSLALEARTQRRTWTGTSGQAVALACQAALSDEDWQTVFRLGLAAPDGEATPAEARDDVVLWCLCQAAAATGQAGLLDDLLKRVTQKFDQRYYSGVLSHLQGDEISAKAKVREALEVADTPLQQRNARLLLARLGHEQETVDGSVLGEDDDAFLQAVTDIHRDNLPQAIQRLKVISPRSYYATTALADALDRLGDLDQAVEVLTTSARRFSDARFLVSAAELLASHDRLAAADVIAVRALSSLTSDQTPWRGRAHDIRIAEALRRRAWHEMEERARVTVEDCGADARRRWLLTGALFNQRLYDQAWRELSAWPPLKPQTVIDATVWANLAVRFDASAKTARTLHKLLQRYGGDLEFRARILALVIGTTFNEPLQEELRVDLQQAIEDFVHAFPNHPMFYTLPVPEDPKELAEILRDHLSAGSDEFAQIQSMVTMGRLPYGTLAAMARRPYAQALLEVAASVRVVQNLSPSDMLKDLEAARATLNRAAIVETSSLVTAEALSSIWPQVLAALGTVTCTTEARTDALRTLDSLKSASGRTIHWDPRSDSPVVQEVNPDALEELRSRAQELVTRFNTVTQVDHPTIANLPELLDDPQDLNFLAWLGPLDLALEKSVPLWSDDAALRALARAVGAQSFGTVALMECLRQEGFLTSEAVAEALHLLRREYCVDLPFDSLSIVTLAREADWQLGPASTVFTRPTTWLNAQEALRVFGYILDEVAEAPELLAAWYGSALLGLTCGRPSFVALEIGASLLLKALGAASDSIEALPALVAAARFHLAEPDGLLERVVILLGDLLTPDLGVDGCARAVLDLASKLEIADRDRVRQLVFAGKF